MTTYENAPPPDDWRPFAKHCGLLCFDTACPICGEIVLPRGAILGEN